MLQSNKAHIEAQFYESFICKTQVTQSIVNVKYGLETYYTNLLCIQRGCVHSEIKEKAEIRCKTLEHQTRFCLRLRMYDTISHGNARRRNTQRPI